MALRVTSVLALVAFALTAVGCSGASSPGTSAIPQTMQARTAQAVTPHASTNPTQNIPITGTAPNSTFSGTFSISKFVSRGKALYAVGTLAGTLTNTVSGATQTVNQVIRMPVTSADPSCTILTLTLGPLDLNLLGLMVHLDRVVLTITAQQGPGNLARKPAMRDREPFERRWAARCYRKPVKSDSRDSERVMIDVE